MCFVIYPFQRMNNFGSRFFEESFFCIPNYIIISLQVTSPRTKFQQYFKFDRPKSFIQQQKPPGHKFTLAQGLVFFFCTMFPPLENGQIAQ